MSIIKGKNPLTRLDYPDPDVIRVGDTYYIVSTTMYFMPGCVILKSYDLVNWEYCTHVYDKLEDTERENLGGCHAYGNGMWAPTIRYHDGVFHIVFVANDTHKTYHFTATDIMGPWKKGYIEGFYHDPSLLFDDDGKVYIMYGNRDIRVTELESDLSKPKAGGVDKVVIQDAPGPFLGYEGCHLYKLGGKYYAFFIHSAQHKWLRIEACFISDRIDEGWVGRDVLVEEDYAVCGVAQGGIVDTPNGDWYGIIFSDYGAVGRIPHLCPMHFGEDGFPVFDPVKEDIECESTRPEHVYSPLYHSDNFTSKPDGAWEFNHNPIAEAWRINNGLEIDALPAETFDFAKNTLTQRALYPRCAAEVTVDASRLAEGGFAGIAAMQYRYGALGIAKTAEGAKVELRLRTDGEEFVAEEIALTQDIVKLRIVYEFGAGRDYADFYVEIGGEWRHIGPEHHRMNFDLRHFTGCRFGLFSYGKGKPCGTARFTEFVYEDYEK